MTRICISVLIRHPFATSKNYSEYQRYKSDEEKVGSIQILQRGLEKDAKTAKDLLFAHVGVPCGFEREQIA